MRLLLLLAASWIAGCGNNSASPDAAAIEMENTQGKQLRDQLERPGAK